MRPLQEATSLPPHTHTPSLLSHTPEKKEKRQDKMDVYVRLLFSIFPIAECVSPKMDSGPEGKRDLTLLIPIGAATSPPELKYARDRSLAAAVASGRAPPGFTGQAMLPVCPVCVCVCLCVFTKRNTKLPTRIRERTHTCRYIQIYIQIYTHKHTLTCACMYVHTHTGARAYTRTDTNTKTETGVD